MRTGSATVVAPPTVPAPPTVVALLAGLLLATAVTVPAPAGEAAGSDPGMEAMQALEPLVGHWEGEGWMRMGPGEPNRFHSEETVESRLDGRVLIVEGLHRSGGEGDEEGRVVHHALAVISHDPESGGYRFRSHLADGRGGDFDARMEDGAFVWGTATPRGHIRYTIRIDGDRWEEVGERSPDGETWQEFFGMSLTRTGG